MSDSEGEFKDKTNCVNICKRSYVTHQKNSIETNGTDYHPLPKETVR